MRLLGLPTTHSSHWWPSATWIGTMTWPRGTDQRRSRTGNLSSAVRTTTCGCWWRRSCPEQRKNCPVLRRGGGSPDTPWPGYSPCTLSTGRMCSPGWGVCPVPSGFLVSRNMSFPMSRSAGRTASTSLGDKEAKTRNSVLKTVQENTEEIQAFYQSKGIDTVFQLNPGNHFVQGIERTIAGIQWLLRR